MKVNNPYEKECLLLSTLMTLLNKEEKEEVLDVLLESKLKRKNYSSDCVKEFFSILNDFKLNNMELYFFLKQLMITNLLILRVTKFSLIKEYRKLKNLEKQSILNKIYNIMKEKEENIISMTK